MSLVVTFKAKDGIVIAGDSRGTIGDPRGLTAIADVHRKIFKLSPFVGVSAVGAAELASALLDKMEAKLSSEGKVYIDDVIGSFRQHVRGLFNEWFQQFPIDKRQGVLFALGGYRANDDQKEPMIYMLASQADFAPHLYARGACMIGVPQYATYLFNRYYDPEMTKEEAAALSVYVISETASQDPKVGGPINVAIIEPETGYRELDEKEVDAILARNERQNERLKKFFCKRGK